VFEHRPGRTILDEVCREPLLAITVSSTLSSWAPDGHFLTDKVVKTAQQKTTADLSSAVAPMKNDG